MNWLEFWYAALREEYGLRLLVSKIEAVRPKLYAARKDANDPALSVLALVVPDQFGNEIWIVRKEITINAPPEE